jgi:hypothetical protein
MPKLVWHNCVSRATSVTGRIQLSSKASNRSTTARRLAARSSQARVPTSQRRATDGEPAPSRLLPGHQISPRSWHSTPHAFRFRSRVSVSTASRPSFLCRRRHAVLRSVFGFQRPLTPSLRAFGVTTRRTAVGAVLPVALGVQPSARGPPQPGGLQSVRPASWKSALAG